MLKPCPAYQLPCFPGKYKPHAILVKAIHVLYICFLVFKLCLVVVKWLHKVCHAGLVIELIERRKVRQGQFTYQTPVCLTDVPRNVIIPPAHPLQILNIKLCKALDCIVRAALRFSY